MPRLEQSESADAASALHVEAALSLLGTPYRLGGSRPETGFDCSGLVKWVFQRQGVTVPRTVAEQFVTGESVSPVAVLHRGDLVFFDIDNAGPSHVGIALGDGRFVHAPNERGAVRIDVLTSPYWARRYLGARRVEAPPMP